MNVNSLSPRELAGRLRGPGIWLQTGPFTIRVRTPIQGLARSIGQLYADHPIQDPGLFADFHVSCRVPWGPRRWYKPQVLFFVDDQMPFKPVPLRQVLPFFEWALNWCIGSRANQYLIIHAASIERDGRAVIMPAPPTSGKSTLCAALVSRGWRLLSDELAIIRPRDGDLIPLVRPISLKNESIEVIRRFAPEAELSAPTPGTNKGTVVHMKPPGPWVRRAGEPARPAWIIFPRYRAGAPPTLKPRAKAMTFLQISENSFNYSLFGAEGFGIMARLIDACDCYGFSYGNLDEAMAVFDQLEPPAASRAGSVVESRSNA